MLYAIRFIALVGLIAGLALSPARAERRVALVIGNADYKIGPLANPVNDATAVAEAFEKALGFDKVILRKNLTFDGFRAALMELAREVAGAELGVVYFAGHGTEVAGKNFLIPVDARLAKSGDLSLEAIALDSVLEQLAGASRLKLVILDACRNNLFPVAGAKRAVSRGLSRIEPEDNTLVVYAAKDGTTADDGAGQRHSPFTQALLKHLATPGLEINFVFRRVRDDVVAATNPVRTPHVYGTLGGKELYLKPGAPSPAGQAPAPSAAAEAARICREVEGMSNPEMLALLERQHKGTLAGECVAARLAQIKTTAVVTPVPVQPPKVTEPPVTMAPEIGLKPGKAFRDCLDICPEMVVLPAGEFMMGSSPAEIAALKKIFGVDLFKDEGPQRKVTIARAFAVGKYEVTFAEWDTCVADGGCKHRPDDRGWGRGRRPVINVSWHDAKQYVAWISRKTGKTYRLLSEAEWEYAARAGTTTRYAFGDTIREGQAQYSERSLGSTDKTVEVGSFPANRFGLHDMHGNVWEWVEDNWHPNYKGAPIDGSVWPGGDSSMRVNRGGSRVDMWVHLRVAYRSRDSPDSARPVVGFRLARTL